MLTKRLFARMKCGRTLDKGSADVRGRGVRRQRSCDRVSGESLCISHVCDRTVSRGDGREGKELRRKVSTRSRAYGTTHRVENPFVLDRFFAFTICTKERRPANFRFVFILEIVKNKIYATGILCHFPFLPCSVYGRNVLNLFTYKCIPL